MKCINSILNQRYKDIEIILVDDGSTDGSSELCDELSQQYKNVLVKHVQNNGPYMARKEGAKLAHGDVITFVDSDDWMEIDAYEELMRIYKEYKPDIIAFSCRTEPNRRLCEDYYEEGFYDKNKIKKIIIPTMMYNPQVGDRGLFASVCCKLFDKSLFARVTDGINGYIVWGEDALITYPAVSLAESVFIIHKVYYNYRVNDISVTHKFPSERLDELSDFWAYMSDFFASQRMTADITFQMECYMRKLIELLVVNRFGIHSRGNVFGFPYLYVAKGMKIQIYGAGDVGKSYVYELIHSNYAKIVGWYDRNYIDIGNYAGIEIQNPEAIGNTISDMVLVAIQNEETARAIKSYISELGVASEKIVWVKPIMRR